MTPHQREAIELRLEQLKAEMDALDPKLLDPAGIARFARLYEERDSLELQLDDK